MDPITALATANAALELVAVLAPQIEALVAQGQISPEQQAALKKKADFLRTSAAFAGPEWEQSGQTSKT